MATDNNTITIPISISGLTGRLTLDKASIPALQEHLKKQDRPSGSYLKLISMNSTRKLGKSDFSLTLSYYDINHYNNRKGKAKSQSQSIDTL